MMWASEGEFPTGSGVPLGQNAEIHSLEELWQDASKKQTNETKLQGLGWTGNLQSWLCESFMLPIRYVATSSPSARIWQDKQRCKLPMEGLKIITGPLTVNIMESKLVQPSIGRESIHRERKKEIHFIPCCSRCCLWPSIIGITCELVKNAEFGVPPRLTESVSFFNKIPGDFHAH